MNGSSGLDWNDLRYALAVADARTLSAAARRLRVSQPTVGRRLAALESALGVALFLRSSRGFVPTPAGTRLLRSMAAFSLEIEAVERGLIDDEGALRGIVRVAVTEVTAGHLLERAIPRLRDAHPEIVVELRTGNTAADLGRGEADLAVRLLKPEGADLVARKLGMLTYALYASPSYLERHGAPRELSSLEGHEVVAPCAELLSGPEAGWLGPSLRGARASLRSASVVALAAGAAAGLGLVVLPTTIGHEHPGLRAVARLLDVPPRAVHLVSHRQARRVARVRAVATEIASDLGARLARVGRVGSR